MNKATTAVKKVNTLPVLIAAHAETMDLHQYSESTPLDGTSPTSFGSGAVLHTAISPVLLSLFPSLKGVRMSVVMEHLVNNRSYKARFHSPLPIPPSHQVAVVACRDTRLNIYDALGLEEGAAHVIRNMGGVITDAEIRSLAISRHTLGVREIILIHHTDCGMLAFTDESFLVRREDETGEHPTRGPIAFGDVSAAVLQSMQRVADSPFVDEKDFIRGFVFDVATGLLTEVVR